MGADQETTVPPLMDILRMARSPRHRGRLVGPLLALLCFAGVTGCVRQPVSSGRISLTWLIPAGPDKPLIDRLIAGFESAHPGVEVTAIRVPVGQYQSKLKMLIAAGEPPDLICSADAWIGPVAPLLLNLDPWLQRDRESMQLADFPPALLEACRWEGVTRCLPRSFHVSLLYFNRTLFDQAGESYPSPEWHLEDYRAAARRMTEIGRARAEDERFWGTGITTGWWGEWLALVRAHGEDLLDPAGTRCNLRSPAAVEALTFYRSKVEEPAAAPDLGHAPEGNFASGKLAMDYGGHTTLWTVYRQIPDLDWDVVPLPVGPAGVNGAELAIDAVAILARCRHPDLAWDLVKRLLSPSAVAEAAALGAMPVRMSVARETLLAPGRTLPPRSAHHAYAALEGATPTPRIAAFTELAIDIVQPEIDQMLWGRTPVREAAVRASSNADALLRAVGNSRIRDGR